MPLCSDVQAGAAVRLGSALGHTGWDPGLGPERRPRHHHRPPLHHRASHSRLTRHERLKTAAAGELATSPSGTGTARGAAKPQWANGWPAGRWTKQSDRRPPQRAGFGSDCRRSEQDLAADEASEGLWAWRRRSPVDIDRMMAAQRDDRAYHREVAHALGTDWPQPRSVDRRPGPPLAQVHGGGDAAGCLLPPPGNRSTSWELEYEFHTAAARTAELRQLIAEREAQWDGFVGARPLEPQEALRTYEQQQILLSALRKEAEWLRQAARTESATAQRFLSQPVGGIPIDYPDGRAMAPDVGIAWSDGYGAAWAGAAESHLLMMQPYATVAPAAAAPAQLWA
jgi:hypothetical protein